LRTKSERHICAGKSPCRHRRGKGGWGGCCIRNDILGFGFWVRVSVREYKCMYVHDDVTYVYDDVTYVSVCEYKSLQTPDRVWGLLFGV